jgi:Uma2 family endonuclease
MSSFDATHVDHEPPAVDARLVAPGTRYEIEDGVLVQVPPADEPHGTLHAQLSALVEIHAGSERDVAVDMLTRTSQTSDVAPDVSVFPRARDPHTGGRQLEELAFEIVSTQSLSDAGRKAAKLVARGVRRVFAIDLARARALEWSAELATWSVLDPAGSIEDRALAVPLPIELLVRGANADDAIARALLAKHNPVLERALGDAVASARAEGKQEGLAEGKQEGLAEGAVRGKIDALLVMLATRGAVEPGHRARIQGERDPAQLDRWIARVAGGGTLADLLAEP